MLLLSSLRCCTAMQLIVVAVILVTTTRTAVSNAKLVRSDDSSSNRDSNNYQSSNIEITKIEPMDDEHERRLLTCNDYQYKVKVLDTLYMYYVADPNKKSISMKLEYFGTAWLSFGTNKLGKGAMAGTEAWMGLPESPVGYGNPGIYDIQGFTADTIILSEAQILKDGTMEQADGITSISFTRKYTDFLGINQPINVTTPNEFQWAYGFTNVYDAQIHERAGHFGLQIEECVTPLEEIQEIDKRKGRRACGLLKLSIFCPFTQCGIIGRFIGLC
jgi:hypothetical protein